MNQAVYDRLVAIARQRELITYADIGQVADLDVSDIQHLDKLVRILEEIALHEIKDGRPLLVIIVIRSDLNMPAKGLLKFARSHGLMKGQDDIGFFTTELKRVYEAWQAPTAH